MYNVRNGIFEHDTYFTRRFKVLSKQVIWCLEDLTWEVISYEIYETSQGRVS